MHYDLRRNHLHLRESQQSLLSTYVYYKEEADILFARLSTQLGLDKNWLTAMGLWTEKKTAGFRSTHVFLCSSVFSRVQGK